MILFSADWHIKLGQKNVPVEWAKARYLGFFDEIYRLEDDVDLHIIGGDIFDRVPTMEELELFFKFVSGCRKQTIIFDGNHEATKKNVTFLDKLKEVVEKLNPSVSIVTEACEIAASDMGTFSILPYADLHKKNSIEMLYENAPVFTHVRGEIPPHVTPEVDLSRFDRFPVVFAGDLHSHDNCQRNIVYPGSPMTTSFHRSKVKTGVIVIRDDWEWYWEELKLPQLIRKTVKNPKDMIPGVFDHIIYEVEGDLEELSKVKNSELLDKKVIKRSSEATLILDKDMSIIEELAEYLEFILELPEDKVLDIIGTFSDNTKNINVG
jgi:DNA repair exonuclease SbcCD nuclease subunit